MNGIYPLLRHSVFVRSLHLYPIRAIKTSYDLTLCTPPSSLTRRQFLTRSLELYSLIFRLSQRWLNDSSLHVSTAGKIPRLDEENLLTDVRVEYVAKISPVLRTNLYASLDPADSFCGHRYVIIKIPRRKKRFFPGGLTRESFGGGSTESAG